MSATPDPGRPIRYLADITTRDLDAVEVFLLEQIRRRRDTRAADAPEHRAAVSVERITRDDAARARQHLEVLAAGAVTEPSAQLHAREGLQEAWTALVSRARHWEGEEGFDTARWRSVHLHRADERKFEARRAEVLAELDAEAAR